MDSPDYLEEDFSNLDGLEDDVFHSEDCGLASQPNEMTFPGIFTQSKSYNCLLGRFQLFPLTHCCGPGTRHAKQQDKATQTLNPSSSSQDVMLPCGVTEEPQRLFYGNAGFRLHVNPIGFSLSPHLREEPRESPQELRTEVQIARKLQCIADQFHRLHLQRICMKDLHFPLLSVKIKVRFPPRILSTCSAVGKKKGMVRFGRALDPQREGTYTQANPTTGSEGTLWRKRMLQTTDGGVSEQEVHPRKPTEHVIPK
ncbi:bcl-2-modifying factor isoform X2 [Podarcis muralis]